MGDATFVEPSKEGDLSDKLQRWQPFRSESAGSDIDCLEPYQYRPLTNPARDIRLLRLFPGARGEPIRISIFHATLDDEPKPKRPRTQLTLPELKAKVPPGWRVWETIEGRFIFVDRDPDGHSRTRWECPIEGMDPSLYLASDDDIPSFEPEYEALSYTWGASGDGGKIIVQEGTPERPLLRRLSLQDNLMCALQYLRDVDKPRTFWIDGICIKQADDQEKGHQVHRMSVIYQGAYRVVAWLGPEDEAAGQAMQLLSYIGQQIEILDESYNCPALNPVPNPLRVKFPLSPERLDEIDEFLSNPWFRRLWVVQEIRLANKRAVLQRGNTTISFSLFRRAIMFLDSDVQSSHGLSLLARGTTLSRPLELRPFYRIVSMLRGKRCIDPRDKFYGVLGLVPPGFAALVQPDYSITVGEAYRDIVLSHINHTGRLEQLEYTHQFGRKIDTPSWVPDFSTDHFRQTSCGYQQHSSGVSRCEVRYESPGFLHVVGKRCATVSLVSERFRRDYGSRAIATLNVWYSMVSKLTAHSTGASIPDVFANTIQQGSLQERRQALSITKDRLRRRYIRESFSYCSGWALIQTPDGYIGLGPPDAKEGDVLCVLLGCASPVLLRETSPGGHYQVIGTCYVYGLEDAIALLGPLPEPWQGHLENRLGTRRRLVFHNKETGEYSHDDPRLGELGDWERVDAKMGADDPEVFEFFRHKETEEVMNSDPRMLPDALKARGVELTTFVLG
ncbi:heterokaryon incompatibility protein-domain-containing protein [Immersiella caudata]|uniref:Heterokaryon incompatibility protein-domain-containing protein n=1 Tax=Immersiella caudata TaxID=314043 RepID=A0AA40CAT9_9PEZI|nr:heterokaryon incompatibility protein-domain-containing protein [Immersiella caudata]